MSNYHGRKSEFTPAVYTRYFEHTETPKNSSGHIHFPEDNDETSANYQIKRDLLFKRLFPSKYADSNNDQTESEQNHPNRNNNSSNATAQALGDFIPLSNNNSSTLQQRQSSPLAEADIIVSSSDEHDEDSFVETPLPTCSHESIVGHLHPRSTIQNVRAVLIRELYERTSDSNTEWLKCKMELPIEYINPKYYADFQRRYRKDIEKNSMKKKKSNSSKHKSENGYQVYNATTTQSNDTLENDDIIETSFTKPVQTMSSSSPIILSTHVPNQSKSTPEYIVLDSDEDNDQANNLNHDANSSYFIDRSSTVNSKSTVTSTDDYHEEDSKYAQLPSRNTSSSSIIRPILSKKQRRKQSHVHDPPKPLVSAIDRIIEQMDQSDAIDDNSRKLEQQQNHLVKQMKKRKKKKKKKATPQTPLLLK